MDGSELGQQFLEIGGAVIVQPISQSNRRTMGHSTTLGQVHWTTDVKTILKFINVGVYAMSVDTALYK